MTTLIMTAIRPMIGSALMPVSATWREIEGSRRRARMNAARDRVALAARPTKVTMSSVSCQASSRALAELDDDLAPPRNRIGCRQRLEVQAADEIEQRPVLGADAGELHPLVGEPA